ncbi:unnamed protein product, partial [Choristocarpus tenellus]
VAGLGGVGERSKGQEGWQLEAVLGAGRLPTKEGYCGGREGEEGTGTKGFTDGSHIPRDNQPRFCPLNHAHPPLWHQSGCSLKVSLCSSLPKNRTKGLIICLGKRTEFSFSFPCFLLLSFLFYFKTLQDARGKEREEKGEHRRRKAKDNRGSPVFSDWPVKGLVDRTPDCLKGSCTRCGGVGVSERRFIAHLIRRVGSL